MYPRTVYTWRVILLLIACAERISSSFDFFRSNDARDDVDVVGMHPASRGEDAHGLAANKISLLPSTPKMDILGDGLGQSRARSSIEAGSGRIVGERPLGMSSHSPCLAETDDNANGNEYGSKDLSKDDPKAKGERDKVKNVTSTLRYLLLSREDVALGLRRENPKSKGKRDKRHTTHSTLWSNRYNGPSAPIAPYLPASIRWKLNSALVEIFTNRILYVWQFLDIFEEEEKEQYGNELMDALLNITSDPLLSQDVDWGQIDRTLNHKHQQVPNGAIRGKRELTKFGYDCDLGIVTESNDIKHCIGTDCRSNPYAMTIYTNLMEKGVTVDYFSLVKHKIAKKYVLYNNRIFLIHCKKVPVYEIRSTDCYSDGMILVTNQVEELFLARNGFLVRSAIRERCSNMDEIEAVRATSRWQLHLYSALTRLSQVLIFHYDTAELIHKMFNKEAIESLITLEQESLSGHDKTSLYCVLTILFRKFGPIALMVYSSLNLAVSIFLFILSIYKKLNFLSSISILLSIFKKIKDFMKYTEENDIKLRTQLSDGARTMLGKQKRSLGSISTHHFRVLYHSATNTARRLDKLEEDLIQRKMAEYGSDFDPDEISSVATFSSIDLALKDTKN